MKYFAKFEKVLELKRANRGVSGPSCSMIASRILNVKTIGKKFGHIGVNQGVLEQSRAYWA